MITDIFRSRPGAEQAVEALIEARETLFVTPHVVHELQRGVGRAADPRIEGRRIGRIGEKLRVLPFDREAAVLAARMADSLEDDGPEVPELDLFIAASAIVWGDGVLVTRDEKHFTRLRKYGLQVHPI